MKSFYAKSVKWFPVFHLCAYCVTSSSRILDSYINLDVSCFYGYQNVPLECSLKETEWEVVEWVLLPQNRNEWQAVVNMVTNLRVS